MKTLILTLLKGIKSFNNLILNYSIKRLTSFSLFKVILKYLSYFRFILEYFKGYRYYKIFKAFFKFLALINIILGLFTLIVFTDFRFEEYKNFMEYNLTNFSFSDSYSKLKIYTKIIWRKIINLFVNDPIADSIPNKVDPSYGGVDDIINKSYKLPKEDMNYKSYINYYLIALTTVSIILVFKYPEYTINPIISGVTAFFTSLFGGDDNSTDGPSNNAPSTSVGDGNKPRDINILDKGKAREIPKLDIENLPTSSNSEPATSVSNKSGTSNKSVSSIFKRIFPNIFDNSTVASIHTSNPEISSTTEWDRFSWEKSNTSSPSSSDTITKNNASDYFSNTEWNSPSTSKNIHPSPATEGNLPSSPLDQSSVLSNSQIDKSSLHVQSSPKGSLPTSPLDQSPTTSTPNSVVDTSTSPSTSPSTPKANKNISPHSPSKNVWK